MPSSAAPFELHPAAGYTRLTLRGDLDTATAEAARAMLEALVADTPSGRYVVDLAGRVFIDSAGLGALVATYRDVRAKHGDAGAIVLLHPTAETIDLLALTHLDRYLPWFRSWEEARAACDWLVAET